MLKNNKLEFAILSLYLVYVFYYLFYGHPMDEFVYSDMRMYVKRGLEISRHDFQLDHFFQPIGYNLWVALAEIFEFQSWNFLKASNLFFCVGSVFLGWRISTRFFDKKWSLVTLLLMCLHLQWVMIASYVISEIMYTFFVTLLLYLCIKNEVILSRARSIWVGIVFGLGFYIKGTLAFWPFIYGFFQLLSRKIKMLLFISVGGLLILGMHYGLSYHFYGKAKLSGEAGGLNFVEGKCPWKNNYDTEGYNWHSPLFFYLGEHEKKVWPEPFSNQSYYWSAGLQCIKNDPMVLLTSFRYIYYLYAGNPLWPVSFGTESKLPALANGYFSYVIFPLVLLGLILILKNNMVFNPQTLLQRQYLVLITTLFALYFSVWLFKSEQRFRLPFDVIHFVFVTYSLRYLTQKVKSVL